MPTALTGSNYFRDFHSFSLCSAQLDLSNSDLNSDLVNLPLQYRFEPTILKISSRTSLLHTPESLCVSLPQIQESGTSTAHRKSVHSSLYWIFLWMSEFKTLWTPPLFSSQAAIAPAQRQTGIYQGATNFAQRDSGLFKSKRWNELLKSRYLGLPPWPRRSRQKLSPPPPCHSQAIKSAAGLSTLVSWYLLQYPGAWLSSLKGRRTSLGIWYFAKTCILLGTSNSSGGLIHLCKSCWSADF